jgi:hypothetical protein
MKKLVLICLAFLFIGSANAQSEKYLAAMKKSIAAIDSSFKNPSSLLKLAAQFERIALVEKNQWLPYYYAAFCEVNYGFMEQDKSLIDAFADKATALINIADSLSPSNSEISCIKSMIASCHMMVNPMQRWAEYGPASNVAMEAAIQQDATNPRPYFLKGQGLMYTPENFGGGCKTAKPVLEIAATKFATFKPVDEMYPTWGKEIVDGLLQQCK